MEKFQKFYNDNGGRLFGYLLRKSGCRQLAMDLVQESFTRYLERYGARKLKLALLFTIGRNLFFDQMRSRQRSVSLTGELQESDPGQEESYILREDSLRVLSAMQQLTDEDRDILAMVAGGGLSYKEIAVVKKCSEASVKVRVHRARKRLRECIREGS